MGIIIEKNLKIIIGYSDVTAILFGIYAMTGISTFYGPALVATFGELEPFNELSYRYFNDVLVQKDMDSYLFQMPNVWTEDYMDWESQTSSKIGQQNQWLTRKEGMVEG